MLTLVLRKLEPGLRTDASEDSRGKEDVELEPGDHEDITEDLFGIRFW